MKGTPGFTGIRLREAREARGLTAIALAQLLGVTRAAVSQYETGDSTPQPEMMEKIAATLNFPMAFFLRPNKGNEINEPIFYRSMASATKEARLRGKHRYLWLKEVVAFLRSYVKFPTVNFPDTGVPDNPVRLTSDDIEVIATTVRRTWGLGNGPISNVCLLAENNGALVSRFELGAATLDAFSAWAPGPNIPFVILGSDKGSAVRSRYDIAHELGHLVLHRKVDETRVSDGTTHKLLEEQAHRFASAFLLPSLSFAEDAFSLTLDSFRALKPKWRVSIAMMIYRAQELGFIPEEQARRMWINYNRRGWRTHEPLDDQMKIEEPVVLRRAFEVLIDNRLLARSQVIASLPYNARDIEEITNLPHEYLEDDSPYVWAINTLNNR